MSLFEISVSLCPIAFHPFFLSFLFSETENRNLSAFAAGIRGAIVVELISMTMRFSVLVWFIFYIAALNKMRAKALPQPLLDSDSDLFQETADDDPTLVSFSSTITDPVPQAALLNTPEFPLPLLSSDDSLLTAGLPSSDFDFFVANSCSGDESALFNKHKRDGGQCDITDTNSHDLNNIDLLQKLGQEDNLWKLIDPTSPPREEPELLENENEKMTLPGPYDVGCDPEFPFRLCCDGPYDVGEVPYSVPFSLRRYESMRRCTRSMYYFFGWGVFQYNDFASFENISLFFHSNVFRFFFF